MKTTKLFTFKQIIILLNCLILIALPVLVSAQLSGKITAVKDSDGNELGNENPKRGEVYTIEFTGNNIKDFHIKLGDTTATVCSHAGEMPEEPSDCNIDIFNGSFTNSGTHTEAGDSRKIRTGKYISLWKGGAGIDSGSFQIRINSGTPGKGIIVVATSDGDSDPWNGTAGNDYTVITTAGPGVSYPPILISAEEVPTLSEWGVIILILLTLSLGMVFLSKRETALAVGGNTSVYTPSYGHKLFDKTLYIKVFSVVLLIGFGLLGLSYIYFGEITPTDPFGTVVSAAIVAYMVHFWLLRKSQPE